MTVDKFKCEICGKIVTANNSYVASHIQRVHKITLVEYVSKYFIDISGDFKIEKCGFCNRKAVYLIDINYKNKTFKKYYDGYFCKNNECRNNISLEILNKQYDKKSYEHIGCHTEYLSKLYKLSIEDAKKLKYDENKIIEEKSKTNLTGYVLRYGEEKGQIKYKERNDKISKPSKKEWYIETYGDIEGEKRWISKFRFKTNLEGFILKYGEIEGTKKYKERCQKIGASNRKEWYIEKFGEVDGNYRWDTYMYKLSKVLQKRVSNASTIIKKLLEILNIEFIMEYKLTDIRKICDYFIPEYNLFIEFFGDYYHCNPKHYDKTYYNEKIKKYAKDVWDNDKERLNLINEYTDKGIIIIWESTIITSEYLYKLLEDFKNKKCLIYI